MKFSHLLKDARKRRMLIRLEISVLFLPCKCFFYNASEIQFSYLCCGNCVSLSHPYGCALNV